MHVDSFICRFTEDETEIYAAFCLMLFRLPAVEKCKFTEYVKQYSLFCIHEDTKYRVTGASRLGDIWLAKDHTRTVGYDKRVNVEDCSNWSKE